MLVSITIKKLGLSYERDTEELPQASRDYLMQNGFSQRLRDVHASVKRDGFDSDEAFASAVKSAVDHALEQLDTGNFQTRVPNPVMAVAREFAKVAATPEEIAKALEFINKQRVKSGQQKAA